ncbi:MAG: hypothetical protein QOF62_1602 [Pyrinomonadaceae bacterium]|jgi:hypothetical protein|nr:hypothetical protein [Pyrinomonadaceae bacterium]
MSEKEYNYQIIRYIPDLRRMEPQNIGILVQDELGTTCRMWTHFRPLGDKPDFDYYNFRKWREFFELEVNGPQIEMFQPPRESAEFLEYLQSRCKGNYTVTRPLHVTMDATDIEVVKDHLFETLVRAPEEEEMPATQPVKRFKQQLEKKKLDKNSHLQVDEYLVFPSGETKLFHWQYKKNHGSDERVLIEPVQWLDKIRLTQLELEHSLSAAQKVRDSRLRAHLIVIMDEVAPPSHLAKEATKRLYENYLEGKKHLKQLSDEVVANVPESEELVSRIEDDLNELVQV